MRFTCKLALLFVAAVFFGCDQPEKPAQLEIQLADLSKIFGINWPSNSLNQHVAVWKYHAWLDGGSDNIETVARFDVPANDFSAWKTSVTNRLKEYLGFGLVAEPRLISKHKWWNGHVYPSSQVDLYVTEINRGPKYLAQLSVYVRSEGERRIFYVQAHVLTR